MSGELDFPILFREALRNALQEDLGHGDITSVLTVPGETKATARIIAKEDIVLAGAPVVKEIFSLIDPDVAVSILVSDGSFVRKGETIAELSGGARSLLAGERTALNVLQRISGVATLTRAYVDRVKGLPVRIVDTRKTTPGMRFLEKYGVAMGGGVNHRFGLYDGILIKDNHVKIAGGVRNALERAKKAHHLLKMEVEVRNLGELAEALEAGADVIMLDNMSVAQMKEAVRVTRGNRAGVILDASGNVGIGNVREIAETGVDLISVGALTHSVRAVDISMKIVDVL